MSNFSSEQSSASVYSLMDHLGHPREQNNLCPFHYYLYSITQKVMEGNWSNIQYTMTCQQDVLTDIVKILTVALPSGRNVP